MGMTDEDIAAAKARLEAKVEIPVEPEEQTPVEETTSAPKRKWLAIGLSYLLAGLAAAAVQVATLPYTGPDKALDYEFRFVVLVLFFMAAVWLVPWPAKQSSLMRGFGVTVVHGVLLAVVVLGSGIAAWQFNAHIKQQALNELAAIEADRAVEEEILRAELEAQAFAEQIAERAAKRAAINRALAVFELPILRSNCDWGYLPTDFETVSYRKKVQAIFAERSQALETCLEQEMNQNFDAFSGFLSYQIGGAHYWIESERPAKTWTELSAQMGIDYPSDVCLSSCGDQLIALRDEIGKVAQQKADAFDARWMRYMRSVVNPAIAEGDELDWEIEQQAREEKAAEESYERSREIASRNADGGFGEFMRGITQASNDMVRRTETPSNRYQRMVNENLRNEGAKQFWAKKEGIILDSKTVPNAKTGRSVGPTAEREPGSGLTKIESCPPPPLGKFCPGKPGTSEPLHPAQCASDRAETARAVDNWRGSLSMYCRAQHEQRGSGSGRGKQK